MKFGVQVRATAEGVDLVWIARQLEARGIESIFLPEHTHVPVLSASEHPGGRDLMDAAKRGYDPLVALAVIAGATDRLRLGTGILLLPQHDPILLAKQAATLDVLSGGRLMLGIGAGWAVEEMANHGVNPARRWAIAREKILAMKAIWTHDRAEFHGEFVQFDPIWQWPKPIQQPHVPIYVAGEGPMALDRVIEFGDGWIPNYDDDTLARLPELRYRASVAGRGPIHVTVYSAPWDRNVVEACRQANVDRLCFNLPSSEIGETERALERLSTFLV